MEQNHKHVAKHHLEPGDVNWPGYGLAELQFRREVNNVKQEIVKQRLMMAYGEIKESRQAKMTSGIWNNFNGVITAVNYGLLAYKMFTRVRRLFRK